MSGRNGSSIRAGIVIPLVLAVYGVYGLTTRHFPLRRRMGGDASGGLAMAFGVLSLGMAGFMHALSRPRDESRTTKALFLVSGATIALASLAVCILSLYH